MRSFKSHSFSFLLFLICGAIVICDSSDPAAADSIRFDLVSAKVTGPQQSTFQYNIDLGANSAVDSSQPSEVEFFDFVAFKNATFTPAAAAAFNLTVTPFGPLECDIDSFAVPNVLLTYTGPRIENNNSTPINLGTLTVNMNGFQFVMLNADCVASQDYNTLTGQTEVDNTDTLRPTIPSPPILTPLPSGAMGGLAVLALLGLLKDARLRWYLRRIASSHRLFGSENF